MNVRWLDRQLKSIDRRITRLQTEIKSGATWLELELELTRGEWRSLWPLYVRAWRESR